MAATTGRADASAADARLNAGVWATEWAYLTAGLETRGFIAGERTLGCPWRDQFIAHVAWLTKPYSSWRTDRPPCEHPYSFYVPADADRARWFPGAGPLDVGDHREWALFMSASDLPGRPPRRVTLTPARTDDDWEVVAAFRDEVERAYPRTYTPTLARRMVALTRARLGAIAGACYLAEVGEAVVGGVGLTLHDTPVGRLGRLRDVDVLPAHQGQGLGDELLAAACQEARRLGVDGVCLRAFEHDWPKDWYLRRGFRRVGGWTRFFRW